MSVASEIMSVLKAGAKFVIGIGRRLVSRYRVRNRLQSASEIEIEILASSFAAAAPSADHIFSWDSPDSGLDPLEGHLHLLLDENAIIRLRREKDGRGRQVNWYRITKWFYRYYEKNKDHIGKRTPGQ
jgi:hypothetical protein